MTDVIEYVWLIDMPDESECWRISDWEGKRERELDPRTLLSAKIDLDEGKPVYKKIGSGKRALHIRLEYVQDGVAP